MLNYFHTIDKRFLSVAAIGTVSFILFVLAASYAVYNGARERREQCQSQNEIRLVVITILTDAREQFADPHDPTEQAFYERSLRAIAPIKCR